MAGLFTKDGQYTGDQRCDTCYGRGVTDKGDGDVSCEDCEGTGLNLTDAGKELVQLLVSLNHFEKKS